MSKPARDYKPLIFVYGFLAFAGIQLSRAACQASPEEPIHGQNDQGGKSKGSYDSMRLLLVWGQNPAQEALINWGLDNTYAGKLEHTLYYSETQHFGDKLSKNYEGRVTARESGMAAACGDRTYTNLQAQLSGLKPATRYFFVAVSGSRQSRELSFVTAPLAPEASFKLLSGGDSRTDRTQRVVMNRTMRSMLESDPTYLALVHGGDFITMGSSCQQWREWREDHEATITGEGRILPLIATFGNHEIGGEAQFNAQFGSPTGPGKFYFHSRIGRLDLIILNSEISIEGEQKVWLTKTLKERAAESGRFLVAGYHRPAWPGEKSPADTVAWVPLFERYKVDLVLESDGHILKQTCPIRAGVCTSLNEGIVYVGEGGLGVRQRQAARAGAFYFEQGGYAYGQHHVQSLAIPGLAPSKSDVITYQVFFDEHFHHTLRLPLKVRGLRAGQE